MQRSERGKSLRYLSEGGSMPIHVVLVCIVVTVAKTIAIQIDPRKNNPPQRLFAIFLRIFHFRFRSCRQFSGDI